ncbi:hypothetical protein Fmac_015321 [Flemingia macrophylla]|uniref:Uncharacterized protein n=1 Tax=Flemingia macrophylla TaxID=520843 RepID=A0ABD1ME82_9FABA
MMPLSLEEFMMWLQIHLLKLESFCGIRSSNDHYTSVCPSSQQSGVHEYPEAYAPNTDRVHDVATDTSAEARKLEGKLDALVRLVTQLATNQKPASVARFFDIRSSNDHHTSFSARNDVIVIRGVHDVVTDTSLKARKLEGKLDALVSLVTQLAVNQKPASIGRVCGISSSNDHHTSVSPSSQQSGFSARNDAIVIRGVHDVAIDTSAKARKLEGKLEALVSLVTQLAVNQKPASVARVCGIRSSNDHHTSVCPSSQQSGVDEHPEAYAANTYCRPPQQGVHNVATDTSAEARKLQGKLDALVSMVTQLVANQNPASVARVSGIRSSNDHHTSVCPSSPQSGFSVRNDAIVIRGVHDVATDTYAEARKLEGKLDALVSLVTQLAANQKPASVVRVCGIRSSNDHHTSVCPSSQQSGVDEHPEFSARNYAIVIRGVHDVVTDTSAKARNLEGKLDALVSLVTQLAAYHKPASVARVCEIRSSNYHDVNVCPSSQQYGVDEHPEAYTAISYRRPPQSLASVLPMTSTLVSILLRSNLEWMSILRLMLQTPIADHHSSRDKALDREDGSQLLALTTNQNPASVVRVCGIRSSNDHYTSVCPSSQQSGVHEHPEAYAPNTDNTSTEARKLDGKLDATMSLVALLAANQKPASVARVCGIRYSNDHHTSVCPSSQQSRHFSARNDAIVIRGVHDVATDTFALLARKLEGKLGAHVNLVTQLTANQKPASVARVCGIRSSNDHHTRVCPSSQNDAIVIRGVHDVATDTSTEARKLEGNLDALVNLVTQLAANQKPVSITRVGDIRSSNDHHTSVCPSSQQSGVDEHPEAYAANTYTRKLEGKLDALVKLVTQLAANQKPASVVRVCDIRSSNNHHTSVCPSSQQSGVDEHAEAYAANTYSRPRQQQR